MEGFILLDMILSKSPIGYTTYEGAKSVAMFEFDTERQCPKCSAVFKAAERKEDFDPVIVVLCPDCGQMLWRAGCEESAPLHLYDPEADAGGI